MERWRSGGREKRAEEYPIVVILLSCLSTDQVAVSGTLLYSNIISDSFPSFNQDKNLELVKFSNFAEL